MRPLTWQIRDRMNLLWIVFCLVMAAIGLVPVLWDQMTTALVLWVGLMLIQAGFYATMREVSVTVDRTGITKTLGNQTWVARWTDITEARLRIFWGSTQLIVVTTDVVGDWGLSNKLLGLGRVPRDGQAVEVDPTLVGGPGEGSGAARHQPGSVIRTPCCASCAVRIRRGRGPLA